MPPWTTWPTIGCRDESEHEHATIDIEVDLSERHGYMDCAPVPEWLQPDPFRMEVWDWTKGPYDPDGPWCPARCIVSSTITELGIWEPRETIGLLHLFENARLDGGWDFVDIGAQLGWFSILALKFGLNVTAVEADPEVAAILSRNLDRNGTGWEILNERVGPGAWDLDTPRPTIVKIDIEGAEPYAVTMLERGIKNGTIQALVIEISPSFGIDYRPMVEKLVWAGFDIGFLPGKSDPPLPLDSLDRLAWHWTIDDAMKIIEANGQINAFFKRNTLVL